jgi:hypothetical protein
MKLQWTQIKTGITNKVIHASYAIVAGLPIILSFFETSNHKPIISTSFFEVFYSGILLILVYSLFSVWCPKIIKEFSTMEAYILARRPTVLLIAPDLKKNIVMANLQAAQTGSSERIEMLNREINEAIEPRKKSALEAELIKLVDELHPSCVDHYLGKEWHYADLEENKHVKTIAMTIYSLAIILALLVFIHRIAVVINYQLQQS